MEIEKRKKESALLEVLGVPLFCRLWNCICLILQYGLWLYMFVWVVLVEQSIVCVCF